jgi:DNA-binding transcriptional regulator GbsR (MarR family)
MGQQEVYEFLAENSGEWYSSRNISDELGVSIGSVTMSLKKLRDTDMIEYKEVGKRNTYHYTVQEDEG